MAAHVLCTIFINILIPVSNITFFVKIYIHTPFYYQTQETGGIIARSENERQPEIKSGRLTSPIPVSGWTSPLPVGKVLYSLSYFSRIVYLTGFRCPDFIMKLCVYLTHTDNRNF